MTLLLKPTRQLPPAGNGHGGLRPLAAGFGRWKEAIFACFGILIKKRAFFNESSAQPRLEAQKSAILPTKSGTLLTRAASSLPKEVTSFLREEASLPREATFLPKKMTSLQREMTSLPNEMAFLPKEMASEDLLIKSVTNLTWSKPAISDKMAQIMVLQADLTTAKTPRTPRVNFVKQLAGAGVARLKLKEVRDSLHRLLHSLINFNAPNLKTGIQGVGYASNNDSAAWRLLLPGG